MSQFFGWLALLPPLAQIPVVLVVFAAAVGLVLLTIDIVARSGRRYTWIRLAIAAIVPVAAFMLAGTGVSAWWVFVLAAVLGAGLYLLDLRSRQGAGNLLQLAGFLSPALVLISIGLLYPSVKTIVSAFVSNDGSHFVGLDNFVWVFSPGAQGGLVAVLNSILWVALAPVVATAVGLAFSVFVDRSRGEKILKVFIFMPVAISLVGATIIFKFLYDYQQGAQIGLLNQIVVWFGGQPVSWLQVSPLNTFLLMAILIWSQAGFAMVLLSVAIRNVPEDQIEAARLDGANGWQLFRNITVPGIRSTLVVVWITISIISLKVYDVIAAGTAGQNNTTVLGYSVVQQIDLLPAQSGHSAALAMLMFLLVVPFIIYNARNLKKGKIA